ncbi:hypothetical protein [Desulfobacter latus]|uniref:Fibronectin type III domain-containing protein n=1 Tax=Desulfobacter latus TaxID=2292 RepID=A0A850T1Q2_9BACT|nr:hypothetical protein [Desulfobacter latus]NWH05643.1 hypothetical protein [Desulfobacter latus]
MLQRFFTIFTLTLFCLGIASGPAISSDASQDLVDQGRSLFFSNANPTYQNILDADVKFKDAVTADPTNQNARVFRAVTRMVGFALSPSAGSGYQNAADVISAMGIPIISDRLISMAAPYDEVPELGGLFNPPGTLPNGDEIRGVINKGLVGIINDALADLDVVTSNYALTLTGQEVDEISGIEVDYTDILFVKSALNAIKAVALVFSAYDLDAADANDLVALLNAGMADLPTDFINQFLTKYPDFLTLDATGSEQLDQAKAALQRSYDLLVAASQALAAELPGSQDNDFFVLEDEGDEMMLDNIINMFSEGLDSLTENRPMTVHPVVLNWQGTDSQENLFFIELEKGELGNGKVYRTEDMEFHGYIDGHTVWGDILSWDINDQSEISMILAYWGDHRIVLNGTLNDENGKITGTLSYQEFNGAEFDETRNNDFTADLTGEERDDLERVDFNAIFGNATAPEKEKLDIRDHLPEFDVMGEPLKDTLPEPVMNGFFPDFVNNAQVTEKLELEPGYHVFEIPKVTTPMAMDGDDADWPETAQVAEGLATWETNKGVDIVKVYLARDDNYLYCAMALAGDPVVVDFSNSVHYTVAFQPEEDIWWRDKYEFQAYYDNSDSGWKSRINYTDSQGQWYSGGAFDSTHVGAGTRFLEWKIPVNHIEKPLETFGGDWIDAYTWWDILPEGDWVDINARVSPVFDVPCTIAVPDHDSGNIYYYLSKSAQPPTDAGDAITGGYLNTPGAFALAGAPYSSEPLYLYVFWDRDENGILNAGDCTGEGTVTFNAQTKTYDSVFVEVDDQVPPDHIDAVNVKNVHCPDGQFRTYFDVDLGQGYRTWDIKQVIVTDPDGDQVQIWPAEGAEFDDPAGEDELSCLFYALPGSPKLGKYTFRVTTSDGLVGTMSDTQKDLITIPIVDTSRVRIETDSKTPIFRWPGVSAPGTGIAYRLEVSGVDVDYAFKTGRAWGMTTCTLPELMPGKIYKYRIRACDDSDWIAVDNRSHTDWITFTMDPVLTHGAVPAVDLDGWGAVKYAHVGQAPGLDLGVNVADHDGVSHDGSSHTVYALPVDEFGNQVVMEGGDTRVYLNFNAKKSEIKGHYSAWIDSGNFAEVFNLGAVGVKFVVVDPDGIQASVVDMLDSEPMTPPASINLSCEENGTTPKFSWHEVAGANRYRIRIYNVNGDGSRGDTILKWYTGNTTETTIPPGFLAPNTKYQYRLEAGNAHMGRFETDENITFPVRDDNGDYPAFATGSDSEAPFIQADTLGAATWHNDYMGVFLYFGIQVYDAQGVGNIDAVTVTLPDGTTKIPLRYEYDESDNCGVFNTDAFVPVQYGTYTFEATDKDGHTATTVTEILSQMPEYIHYPDASTITADVVDHTGVEFNWNDVPGPAFYRIEIYDKENNNVFNLDTTENQYALAPGFLKENEPYRFRITGRDQFFDQNVDHGAASPWSRNQGMLFKTGPAGSGGTHAPVIDENSSGAYIAYIQHPVTGEPSYGLNFSLDVEDQDGVPGNIKSVAVQGPAPGGLSCELGYHWEADGVRACYWGEIMFDSLADIPEGKYTFTVEDEDGNSTKFEDDLVKNPVPLVEYKVPAGEKTVGNDNPKIAWDAPEGGPYFYKVNVYRHWNNQVHSSGILNTTSYMVPHGLLSPGETYNYRIYVYEADPGVTEPDNVSIHGYFTAQRNYFKIPDEVEGFNLMDDIFEPLKTLVGNQGCLGVQGADADEDGKIGLPDILTGLQRLGDHRDTEN